MSISSSCLKDQERMFVLVDPVACVDGASFVVVVAAAEADSDSD